ncbi:HAD hydrolase-like protein [Sporolactobacillus sp. CPB3-1]|uniref:HAD hydrolase-like protein n=1 Tax=Sporolactobacillus mangiferae TaxID=2940498 RepID=A0ABT0M8F7_9BACL|nr:HAD hydrolase-like protein [Sporolactobacillus mangiferae]MCL1631152.1 HAD hydrolase-like protein [Sporolactobacillus mangiferae]
MIQTVLFDVDGVFLSEERYFDASALTVRELLLSENYLGIGNNRSFQTDYSNEEIAKIRAEEFLNDDVLNFLKSRGMNANWDMIYITFSVQLIHLITQLPEPERGRAAELLTYPVDRNTLDRLRMFFKAHQVRPDFSRFMADYASTKAVKQELIIYLNELAGRRLGIETDVFQPKSALWHVGEHASQEWYIGDEHVLAATGQPSVQTGKKGFMNEEVTLAAPDYIRRMFRSFSESGLRVGIATGRPRLETVRPFTYLHWIDELDPNHIVTADDVLDAERRYDAAPLAKPHPFTYLASFYGKDSEMKRWTVRQPEKLPNGEQTLIVGDSLADLLCAKQIGCRFAGVLTGLSGQKARTELAANGADFILDSVADIKDLVFELLEK